MSLEPLGLKVYDYYFLYLVNGVTEVKTVKISKRTYNELCKIAGELQIGLGRPVSLEEAMAHLIGLRGRGVKITDLAGSWTVTEEELVEIKASLSEAWKKWRLPEL